MEATDLMTRCPRKTTLRRRARRRVAPARAKASHLQPVRAGDAGRARTRGLCPRPRSPRKHGAAVRTFMPTLLVVSRPAGRAAWRRRHAWRRGEPALPRAVPRPADRTALTASLRRPPVDRGGPRAVRRDEIVEVGNLAGANCRAAVRMVAQLPVLPAERAVTRGSSSRPPARCARSSKASARR